MARNNIGVEVDVSESDLTKLENALEEGLEDGIKDSLGWMVRNGKSKAKSRIRATDRIWRRRVYHGWQQQEMTIGDEVGHAEIVNTADHARIVDEGLQPMGELPNPNPSVQDIIPWVSSELYPSPHGAISIENWDPELQALASEYSPGYVLTAFAVKNKLDEKGYPGIDFTGVAERYLEKVGPMVIQRKIEKHMNRKLRAYGLK